MPATLALPAGAAPALFDGALALACATGARFEPGAPPAGAGADLLLAAAALSGQAALADAARAVIDGRAAGLQLPPPRAGAASIELALPSPGAAARAVTALSWPLALAGRPCELRLFGPNHGAGPSFHALRLGWAPLAAAAGLQLRLELRAAAFEPGAASAAGAAPDADEQGELRLLLDPPPRLGPLLIPHRGLAGDARLIAAAEAGGGSGLAEAAEACARRLRLSGIDAGIERVPLPAAPGARPRGRWALTAALEFAHGAFAISVCGGPTGPRLAAAPEAGSPDDPAVSAAAAGASLAAQVAAFVASGGALDGAAAERALIPAILCAAGPSGARSSAFTVSEVTPALLALAGLAHLAAPVRAVVDGEPGGPGRVAVAPAP